MMMVPPQLARLMSVVFLLLSFTTHIESKLFTGDASHVLKESERYRERIENKNGRSLDTTTHDGLSATGECPAADCHFCVNPHKHTWAEHEYEALERGCNLATIKNERNQLEIQGLVLDKDGGSMLYVGGIYVESIKAWTWVDGWPSMRFKNWMNGVEPTEESEVGPQSFIALMISSAGESSSQWVPVDGDELLGAVYKCCRNDYNSGIAVRS